MANTFTPVGTGNATAPGKWAGAGVPLPGVATMSSGGVTAPVPVTPGAQSYGPVQPLPIGGTTGTNSTAI